MSASIEALKPKPPALPATTLELFSLHDDKRTLNDHVRMIIEALWDDAKFRRLLDAVTNSDAVEGSMRDDDTMAALMIRTAAVTSNRDPFVASKNLKTIKHALSVFLNRYKISRKLRARMIDGEVIGDIDDPQAD